MLDIGPITKSLWRNKTGPILIIIQLAVTLGILSNALFIMNQRYEKIQQPTGLVENELLTMEIQKSVESADLKYIIHRDMDIIRADSAVIDATYINAIPLSGSGNSSSYRLFQDSESQRMRGNYFDVSEHALNTLGLTLVEGRDFNEGDVQLSTSLQELIDNRDVRVAIITQSLAKTLFPDESALEKTIYSGANSPPISIIGVVKDMIGSWPYSNMKDQVLFSPTSLVEGRIKYLIRSDEKQREALSLRLMKKLKEADSNRIVRASKSLEEIKAQTYGNDYAMIKILSVVTVLILFVNIFGVVGLTTYWVNQRIKQIGIRRALGATHFDISRYFLVENSVLCVLSVVIGTLFSLAVNSIMMKSYASALLPFSYILYGGLLMIIFTLSSASFPAWQASKVSPAKATG